MIYFDNAATGGFKPNSVTEITLSVIKFLSANPGRSGHRLALTGAEIVDNAREELSTLFNCPKNKVIFTKNCTEALNVAIFGLVKKGCHVITTIFEHNSVLRPLYHLKNFGIIDLTIIEESNTQKIPDEIQKQIKPNTSLVVCTAISNVTGTVLPIYEIGQIALKNNLYFVVDGAQGGGHVAIDMKKNNISCLCLAGHKGLYGIMGSGALLISEDVEVYPTFFGGTGSETFNFDMPNVYPERLEAGTLNLPAISSLLEGVRYVKKNLNQISSVLTDYTSKLYNRIMDIEKIKCYSLPNCAGIFSFEIIDMPSSLVCDKLNKDFDIAVRGGLHCAPLIHKNLNTSENGLIRVSLAPQNTFKEINFFINSIGKIIAYNS